MPFTFGLHQLIEGCRRLVQYRDALFDQQPQEVCGGAAHEIGHDYQPSSVQQRAPDFPHGKIERVRMEQCPYVFRAESEVTLSCLHQAGNVLMSDHYAFRHTCRARRVDHIRRVVRRKHRDSIVVPWILLWTVAQRCKHLRAVQQQHVRRVSGQPGRHLDRSENALRGRVVYHQLQSFRWILGVERQVSSPTL